MPRPYFILLTFLALSCVRQETRSTAIRDFRPFLQTGLNAAVAEAHVGYEGAYFIGQHATDYELILLSHCEHPILRAHALTEMIHRPSFEHMKVMLEHLDGTAKVFVDNDEWGLEIRTVSDNMIENGQWKTPEDRQKLIDEILRHHHTLRSAFTSRSIPLLHSSGPWALIRTTPLPSCWESCSCVHLLRIVTWIHSV